MKNCLVCNGNDLDTVIDLGLHPPADTFLSNYELIKSQKLYQLSCQLWNICGHLQNELIVPQKERYEDNDYSYTSANSEISRSHWSEYYKTVSTVVQLTENDPVIEFGSNDGYLAKHFKKNSPTIGIEPSAYLSKLSSKDGLTVINNYLSLDTINQALKLNGKCKLIYGNNVFNHIEKLNDCTKAIYSGLRDDGYFVFESPYALDVIQKYYFDTIYHEHISYFSIKAVDYLLRKNGLFINHIERNLYHGGCIRVYSTRDKSKYNINLVNDYISNEKNFGLFENNIYIEFMMKIEKDKFKTVKSIISMKEKGLKVVAIGAAARSNTLLNYYKLDYSIIDFITDNSPHKIGKFTPGSSIPIRDDNSLKSLNPDVAIILSWNIGKFLLDKIKNINPNIKVISLGDKDLL